MAAHSEAEAGLGIGRLLCVSAARAFFGRVQRKLPIAPVRAVRDLVLPRAGGTTAAGDHGADRARGEQRRSGPARRAPAPGMGSRCTTAAHLEWHLVSARKWSRHRQRRATAREVRAASVFWRAKSRSPLMAAGVLAAAWRCRRGPPVLDRRPPVIARERGQSVTTHRRAPRIRGAAWSYVGRISATDRTLPFYVLSKETPAPITGFSRLGFLDSDLGYRF